MIKKLPQSNGNNLAYEITGKVTIEDEEAWIADLDKLTDDFDKFNVMVILGENASWGMEAGIADIKWIMKHMDKFNKIAIVADSTVWKWLIKVDSFFAQFVGIDEKYFDISKSKEAWEWLEKV
jgi:uncharacterized protein related to proFAR isomerase